MSFKFNLGDQVRDTVTTYRGTIVARTEWMNGCIRYCVQASKLADAGKPVESEHVDEGQLVLLKAAKPKPEIPRGGPRPNPQRAADPVR